jgi:predicted nucleic acid-binding protein
MVVVPDASVILKWVLQREDEPDFRAALRVLHEYLEERIEIRLPTLWRYEVGNILVVKQPGLAIEVMETLLAYQFREETLDRDYCLAVLRFMRDVRGISFYDASYHVLAQRVEGIYLTADHEYAKKTRRMTHIALLSEWNPPAHAK